MSSLVSERRFKAMYTEYFQKTLYKGEEPVKKDKFREWVQESSPCVTELKAYTARSPAPEPSSPSASDSDSSSDSSQSEPEKGGTKERERERSQSLSRAVRRLDIDTPKSGDDNVSGDEEAKATEENVEEQEKSKEAGPLQEENAEDIVMGQNDEMTMAQGTEAEGNKAQGSENDQEMEVNSDDAPQAQPKINTVPKDKAKRERIVIEILSSDEEDVMEIPAPVIRQIKQEEEFTDQSIAEDFEEPTPGQPIRKETESPVSTQEMPQEKAQEKPKPKSKGKGKAKATESDFLDLSSDDSAPLAQSDQEEDVQEKPKPKPKPKSKAKRKAKTTDDNSGDSASDAPAASDVQPSVSAQDKPKPKPKHKAKAKAKATDDRSSDAPVAPVTSAQEEEAEVAADVQKDPKSKRKATGSGVAVVLKRRKTVTTTATVAADADEANDGKAQPGTGEAKTGASLTKSMEKTAVKHNTLVEALNKSEQSVMLYEEVLQARAHCRLGLAKWNVFTGETDANGSTLIVGAVNPRGLSHSFVKELARRFETEGCLSMTDEHKIYIGVHESTIHANRLAKTIEQVLPRMPWTKTAELLRAVLFAGQHRVAAKRLALEGLATHKAELDTKLASPQSTADRQLALQQLREVTAKIKELSYWAVEVYSLDRINAHEHSVLLKHVLASNAMLRKHETEEQSLQLYITLLLSIPPEQRADTITKFTPHQALAWVFHTPFVLNFLLDMFSVPGFMELNPIRRSMLDSWSTSSGVIVVSVLQRVMLTWHFLLTPKAAPQFDPLAPTDFHAFDNDAPRPLLRLLSVSFVRSLDQALRTAFGAHIELLNEDEAKSIDDKFGEKWAMYVSKVEAAADVFIKDYSGSVTEQEQVVLDDFKNKLKHVFGGSSLPFGSVNKFPLLTPSLVIDIDLMVNKGKNAWAMAADAISPMASSIHSTKAPRRLWTDPWVSVHLYVANRILGKKYKKEAAATLAEAIVSKIIMLLFWKRISYLNPWHNQLEQHLGFASRFQSKTALVLAVHPSTDPKSQEWKDLKDELSPKGEVVTNFVTALRPAFKAYATACNPKADFPIREFVPFDINSVEPSYWVLKNTPGAQIFGSMISHTLLRFWNDQQYNTMGLDILNCMRFSQWHHLYRVNEYDNHKNALATMARTFINKVIIRAFSKYDSGYLPWDGYAEVDFTARSSAAIKVVGAQNDLSIDDFDPFSLTAKRLSSVNEVKTLFTKTVRSIEKTLNASVFAGYAVPKDSLDKDQLERIGRYKKAKAKGKDVSEDEDEGEAEDNTGSLAADDSVFLRDRKVQKKYEEFRLSLAEVAARYIDDLKHPKNDHFNVDPSVADDLVKTARLIRPMPRATKQQALDRWRPSDSVRFPKLVVSEPDQKVVEKRLELSYKRVNDSYVTSKGLERFTMRDISTVDSQVGSKRQREADVSDSTPRVRRKPSANAVASSSKAKEPLFLHSDSDVPMDED